MSSGERLRPLRDVLAISINLYQRHAGPFHRVSHVWPEVRCSIFSAPVQKVRTYIIARALYGLRFARLALLFLVLLNSAALCPSQDNDSAPRPARFLGPQSCSSSGCHGGAGENRDQYLVWSKYDFHHARPYATLETARAEHIAEVLKLGAPTRSAACTACHAPFQTVPSEQSCQSAAVSDGVSCESCHGRAEHWLRGHTRHDWTHADRIHAGMRDLRNLYVRANTCVACHQTLANDIRQAGHPELLFELDGQAVSQPKHWPAANDKPGAQIWLVGQAVALREMSWQLSREQASDENVARWSGLVWLLQLTGKADAQWPQIEFNPSAPATSQAADVHHSSDQFAKAVAALAWSEELSRKCLALLAGTSAVFDDQKVPVPVQARRAERLVLALDRLTTRLGAATKLGPMLDHLFDDVQSLPDFSPPQFAKHLQEFHASASGIINSR